MQVGKNKQGFTIVELLIVVVVIAILAAITIVSYNGIQTRAQNSAVASDLSQNAKKIMNASTLGGGNFLPASVVTGGIDSLKFDTSKYKVVTYCATSSEFVLAVETTAGKKYYQKNGSEMVNNNSIDSFQPCPAAGVSGAYTTYGNLPAPCADETAQCTFSGTATVVYGSVAQGRFNRALNQVSPVTCNNTTFSDPSPSYTKKCYAYPN